MTDSDMPSSYDRTNPPEEEPLGLKNPLRPARTLGINQQFIRPLGARSLSILDPSIFLSRQLDDSVNLLFQESPFFPESLDTHLSVVQPVESEISSSANVRVPSSPISSTEPEIATSNTPSDALDVVSLQPQNREGTLSASSLQNDLAKSSELISPKPLDDEKISGLDSPNDMVQTAAHPPILPDLSPIDASEKSPKTVISDIFPSHESLENAPSPLNLEEQIGRAHV